MSGELRVGAEAVDRADLGERLRGGDSGAAGQLEQTRCRVSDSLLELQVELRDLSVQLPAAVDELAREPHLQLLVLAGKPTRDALQMEERPSIRNGTW